MDQPVITSRLPASRITCEKCGYTTYSPSSMWYHRKTHNGIKPYKCQYCSYSALVHSTLTTHMKRRHGLYPAKSGPGRKASSAAKAAPAAHVRSDPTKMPSSDIKKKRTPSLADADCGMGMMPVISSVYTLPSESRSEEVSPVTLVDRRTGEVAMVTSHPEATTTSSVAMPHTSERLPGLYLSDVNASNSQDRPAPSVGAPTIVGLLNNRVSPHLRHVDPKTSTASQAFFVKNEARITSPQLHPSPSASTATSRSSEAEARQLPEHSEIILSSPESDGAHNSEHENGHHAVSGTSSGGSVDGNNQYRQVHTTTNNSHKTAFPSRRHSDGQYSHRCHHCAIGFEDVMMYIIHMGCHNSANPFRCNACNHVCVDKYDFASHLILAAHGASRT